MHRCIAHQSTYTKMQLFSTILLSLLIIIHIALAQYQNRRPSVRVPQGSLIGTKVYSDSGKIADAFFGIPYAQPPIGNLRFAPPQRHFGWNGTLNALTYGPSCPQLPITESNYNEDCLYLNVWSPENAMRYGPVPVVIIFEGIDFARSNRIPIPGQELAMEGVVAVTLNYRMNVFGFLTLGTLDLRGNYGLIDQYFALLWVRENIKHFGGDPERITLFGHSAGVTSIFYHLTSPRPAGTFNRVVLSEGTSLLSASHMPNNDFRSSEKIVYLLGCFNDYPPAIGQCLRSKRTMEILKAYEEYVDVGNTYDTFLPIIDTFLSETEQYLPFDPSRAIKEGIFQQVPMMTGIATVLSDPQYTKWEAISHQGVMQLQQFFEQSQIAQVMRKYQLYSSNEKEITEVLKWRFGIGTQSDVRELMAQLRIFDFESRIEAPYYIQLHHLLNGYQQPIYAYVMEDIGLTLNSSDAMQSFISSDIVLLFGPVLLNQLARRRFTPTEIRFSKTFKQAVINFVVFGNPTPNSNVKVWKRYAPPDFYVERFEIPAHEDDVQRMRRITFWTQLLPKLSNSNFYPNETPREKLLNPDAAAGFRHAMYTLVGLVVALLALLLICIILLKRRHKSEESRIQMGLGFQ